MKEYWQMRLEHERAIRDCHVKAGNITAPKHPDPEGGICCYRVTRFNGPKFVEALKASGHSSAEFQSCCCYTNKRYGEVKKEQ